jgi:hypothetical protein
MCQIYKNELQCEKDSFFCGHAAPFYKKCIPQRWTCDGKADCPNSSDEHSNLCSKGKAKNSKLMVSLFQNVLLGSSKGFLP